MITFSAGQGPTLQAASHTGQLATHACGKDVRVPLERYWVLTSCSCASASDSLKGQVVALERDGAPWSHVLHSTSMEVMC